MNYTVLSTLVLNRSCQNEPAEIYWHLTNRTLSGRTHQRHHRTLAPRNGYYYSNQQLGRWLALAVFARRLLIVGGPQFVTAHTPSSLGKSTLNECYVDDDDEDNETTPPSKVQRCHKLCLDSITSKTTRPRYFLQSTCYAFGVSSWSTLPRIGKLDCFTLDCQHRGGGWAREFSPIRKIRTPKYAQVRQGTAAIASARNGRGEGLRGSRFNGRLHQMHLHILEQIIPHKMDSRHSFTLTDQRKNSVCWECWKFSSSRAPR